MLIKIIEIIFVAATLIQLCYWLIIFPRLAFHKTKDNKSDKAPEDARPVSVVICARNESKNLQENLPRILNQSYRSFEVVVVNDGSTDSTADTLLKFNIEYPNLRSINVDKPLEISGKKYALTKGIDTAKHEVLLLTDADCHPAGSDWLTEMQRLIRGSVTIGLGYAPYQRTPGLLNRWIRFETAWAALQYFSFALWGQAYMGVGRNLIYRKSVFRKTDGFSSHSHLASGDDDLFVNAAADQQNVAITLNPATFVYSKAKKSWRNYYRQKSRHYTTAKHYKLKHQLLLGLYSLSHLLHYCGGIVLILNISTMFVFFFYGIRMLVILCVCFFTLNKLKERDLWRWVPLFDAALILHYLVFLPSLLTAKTKQW